MSDPAPPAPVGSAPLRIPHPEVEKEKMNWLIYDLFVHRDFDACLELIEKQLSLCGGLCEYALFAKAMIFRSRGKIVQALSLFQAATMLNPRNPTNLKQVGRTLMLLGNFSKAAQYFALAASISPDDWGLWHYRGLASLKSGQLDDAEECFRRANAIQRHEETYLQLAKVYEAQDELEDAVEVLTEALEYSPGNPEMGTMLGLLHLRLGESFNAFNSLGNALARNPRNVNAILAAGSIMQEHSEHAVAITKYRVAVRKCPNSGKLWNNIGVAFLSQKKLMPAIVCFKRALYFSPFDWSIAYNLGIAYLRAGQNVAAFHHLSSAVSLRNARLASSSSKNAPAAKPFSKTDPQLAEIYMYVAVTLARLGNLLHACKAYERALLATGFSSANQPSSAEGEESSDDDDEESDGDGRRNLRRLQRGVLKMRMMIELNYTCTLTNGRKFGLAKSRFRRFEDLFRRQTEETKVTDSDVLRVRRMLTKELGRH